MRGLDPRGLACAAAVAVSFGGGLSACTASPRYPVVEGEAPGVGIEPLQPRYPIARAAEATPAAVQPEAVPAPAPLPARETAPRAAPSGEVSSEDLPPPVGSTMMDAGAPASLLPPPPEPRAPPSLPVDPAPGLAPPPTSTLDVAASAATPLKGFLQRDGAGPGRFTIGAPVPPPSVVAPPGPSAPLVYARPSSPPAPSVAPSATASARPNLPPAPSPEPRPSTAASASTGGLPGGPRPYTSLFSPSRPRGPVRSAGIRSTPSDPGIAPRASAAAPDATETPLAGGEATARGKGRFRWPLSGTLISGFGDKGGGVRNDGLNIAAVLGAPVKAAAAGEVVYAGNQVPGSGNLVLVKHPGGWVTEYAHLSTIEVKNRDPVSQGQELGLAGQTGAVDRPQLHFEIRYAPSPDAKAVPVDPAALLPASG